MVSNRKSLPTPPYRPLVGTLKLTRVGEFTPQELENDPGLLFFPSEPIVEYLPGHHSFKQAHSTPNRKTKGHSDQTPVQGSIFPGQGEW